MNKEQQLAPTKQSAMKTIYMAFKLLIDNGGEMPRKTLIEEITKRVSFESWEIERYDSNGQLKWLTIFLFYSIDCIKAGWLTKSKGIWYITPEGKKAYKLGPQVIIETASKAYREWKVNEDKKQSSTTRKEDINITDTQVHQATNDELTAQAYEGFGRYLEAIDDQKFQQLCAALIRAMGYYIDFISPPGKDGGVDIIAFKDPLGFERPRIKIQAKNYKDNNKVDVKPIRELRGLLNANEHVGIFITSSSFTKDAEIFARQSDIHVKLINREELIELWQQYYHKMTEEEKAHMPLHPIYFLGSVE